MKERKIELFVGSFVLVGLAAVLYLAIQVGGASLFGRDRYELQARFGNVTGVAEGSRVEIAGIPVGTVKSIDLSDSFYAIVTMELSNDVELEDDTIASVKTSGLIGERYITLSPGGSGIPLEPGDMIVDTESAVDIEDLISRFAFGSLNDDEEEEEE